MNGTGGSVDDVDRNGFRVYIVIPAYNEEKAIGNVIDEIPKELVHEIVVVDNGSSDQTGESAKRHGAVVLRESERGYGNACLCGIRHVSQLARSGREAGGEIDTTIVAFLDGDHSDHPQELGSLIEPIIRREYELVIGSRTTGKRETGALPLHASAGNRLIGAILSIILGEVITDLGPFRAIRLESLLALNMKEPTFGWTVEMVMKAKCHGLRVLEVPVSYRRRIGESKVTGKPWIALRAFLSILFCIAKFSLECRNTSRWK